MLSLGSLLVILTSFHLVILKMSLHLSLCREIRLLLSQGISGSISFEAESTGSLSHTYSRGKTPVEVHVESCLTSSVKDRESALISR